MLNVFKTISIVDKRVTIRLYNSRRLIQAINKLLKNKSFSNKVLTTTFFTIEFDEFYLLDFCYLLKQLIETSSISFRHTLITLLREIEEGSWIGQVEEKGNRLDYNQLKNLTYTPLDHQTNFLHHYDKLTSYYKVNGVMLSALPGAGKTAMGLFIAECLKATKVVIISPLPAIKRVWEQQIQEVYKEKQSYYLSTDNNGYQGQRFAVYHYEALNKAIKDIRELRSSNTVVIVDEVHNFNTSTSKRTIELIELCKSLSTRDIILASGTPVKALGSELVTALKLTDPLFNDSAAYTFTRLYSVTAAEKVTDILAARLGLVSFKVTRDELGLGVPNFIKMGVKVPDGKKYLLSEVAKTMRTYIEERTIYYIKNENANKILFDTCIDTYKKVIGDDTTLLRELSDYLHTVTILRDASNRSKNLGPFKEEMMFCTRIERDKILPTLSNEQKHVFKDVKTLMKYPILKIQGEALGRVLGKLRMECAIAVAENLDISTIVDEAIKKTVIFSNYIGVCEKIEELLKKEYKTLGVYGTKTSNLTPTVNTFMGDNEYNPLVATYASLSTAVPLISANTVILIDLPYRSYIEEQSIARVHRLGATTATFVYQCYMDSVEPNLSTRTIDILQWSRDQVLAITGVSSMAMEEAILEIDTSTITRSNRIYSW